MYSRMCEYTYVTTSGVVPTSHHLLLFTTVNGRLADLLSFGGFSCPSLPSHQGRVLGLQAFTTVLASVWVQGIRAQVPTLVWQVSCPPGASSSWE